MTQATHPSAHDVEISVNSQPVHIDGPKAKGRAIKQAAIDAKVNIRIDFVLSEEIGDRKTRLIGDDDEVTVHPHQRFIAVAGDDNS